MESTALGKSKEDYLEAILVLNRTHGWCRSVDIARQLGYSKPSVSIALKKLEEEGYINKLDTGEVKLTKQGHLIAEETLEKHQFFTALFRRAGIPADRAEDEACLVEHVISEDSFLKLRTYIHLLLQLEQQAADRN